MEERFGKHEVMNVMPLLVGSLQSCNSFIWVSVYERVELVAAKLPIQTYHFLDGIPISAMMNGSLSRFAVLHFAFFFRGFCPAGRTIYKFPSKFTSYFLDETAETVYTAIDVEFHTADSQMSNGYSIHTAKWFSYSKSIQYGPLWLNCNGTLTVNFSAVWK